MANPLFDSARQGVAAAEAAVDAALSIRDQLISQKDRELLNAYAEIDRLTGLLDGVEPQPFVRFVNWWCADGYREGKAVLHHLDQYGADSPEVAAYRQLVQQTSGTQFSWDVSSLGSDANKTEVAKIDSHRALFGVENIKHVRVFFGGAPPTWTGARIAALKPGDSFLFSSLSTDWAAWDRFQKNTPDFLRGHVDGAFGHEREADLSVSGGSYATWLANNDRMFDVFDANEDIGYGSDHAGKICLYYSQEIEKNADTPDREQMYGGQDRGWFGEDVYNPRAASSYRTADQLVGPIIRFCKEVGRPCAIPELGAERKTADTTGAGRAKMIADIGAYIAAANAA